MSETFLIALITFSAGLVGTLVGVISNASSSRAQRKASIQNAYFHTRISAYSKYYEALGKWGNAPYDESKLNNIFHAIAEACLLGSDSTNSLFSEVQDYIEKYSRRTITDDELILFAKAKYLLLYSMRDDLHNNFH